MKETTKRPKEQSDMPNFEDVSPPLEQLIECIEREISQRERVYPRLIAKGAMSPKFAEQQMRLMQYVLKNLEQQRAAH